MATKKTLAVVAPVSKVVAAIPGVGHNSQVLPDLNNPPKDTALPADLLSKEQTALKWAAETAAIMNDDPDFRQEMQDNWAAEERVKKAPAMLLQDFIGTFTWEALRLFPIPGLLLKDMNKDDTRFSEQYKTVATGKDGVNKEKTNNVYDDLASKLDWVQVEIKERDYWSGVIADPSTIRSADKLKYPNKAARAGQLKLHGDRVKNARLMIRNAMRVFFKMDAIQTRMSLVGCEFRMVQQSQTIEQDGDTAAHDRLLFWKDGSQTEATFDQTPFPMRALTTAKACICCWSKATTGADWQGDDYTVGGFLQLDVDDAIKNGGTYEALVASAGRETAATGTMLPDVTKDTRDEWFMNLARWIKHGNNSELILKDLIAGKLSGAVLVAIEALRGELDVITSASEFAPALDKERKAHDGRSTEAWLKRAS